MTGCQKGLICIQLIWLAKTDNVFSLARAGFSKPGMEQAC